MLSLKKYDIIRTITAKAKGGQGMYYLMNKNTAVAAFEKQPATAFSDEVLFR